MDRKLSGPESQSQHFGKDKNNLPLLGIETKSLAWRVFDSGRVLGVCSNMGCYLEDYCTRMGTWAARTVRRAQGRNINRQVRSYLANTCLCAAVLAILLVTGGVEQNPGPGV